MSTTFVGSDAPDADDLVLWRWMVGWKRWFTAEELCDKVGAATYHGILVNNILTRLHRFGCVKRVGGESGRCALYRAVVPVDVPHD